MRLGITLALGLSVIATGASAQASRDDERPRDRGYDHSDWRRDHYDRDDRSDSRRGRGARFYVQSGDSRLAATCEEGQSVSECVDAALRMYDRVRNQATPSSTPAAPR